MNMKILDRLLFAVLLALIFGITLHAMAIRGMLVSH